MESLSVSRIHGFLIGPDTSVGRARNSRRVLAWLLSAVTVIPIVVAFAPMKGAMRKAGHVGDELVLPEAAGPRPRASPLRIPPVPRIDGASEASGSTPGLVVMHGRILDGEGRPLAGVRISPAGGAGALARSDERGRVRALVLVGDELSALRLEARPRHGAVNHERLVPLEGGILTIGDWVLRAPGVR